MCSCSHYTTLMTAILECFIKKVIVLLETINVAIKLELSATWPMPTVLSNYLLASMQYSSRFFMLYWHIWCKYNII